ncbi:MAG TPA: Crp/Fnr family transcriptional regulator [Burkholderiales bacterium]|nr:Crp/Fnr family transcriptional regulator [Burkholderiales bacterium]
MHTVSDIVSALGNIPLFKELAGDELTRIAERTRNVPAARGEILFHRGEEAKGLHVVLSGQIKLSFISERGDEKVVDIIGVGQSFGEAVMFMESRHVVTAQALMASALLYIPREIIFEELEREPRFARRMIAGLSRRLHHLMGDLEAQSMRSGTQRLIGYLLYDCSSAAAADGALEVTLPTSKGVVASRLNLTRERFSRILHELAQEGMIEVSGRHVRVLDTERLRSFDL